MACKFHAAMRNRLTLLRSWVAVLALALAAPAWGEKADRRQPLVVEADRPGTIDLQQQVVVFNGNVVVTQGTLTIRADRLEVRENPDGTRQAYATGKPATFRQKRDGVDETIEGSGERIEYDGRADTLKLVGNASIRRLRGDSPADVISGAVIVYDNTSEVFNVVGSAPGVAPSNSGGRVRAVLVPRDPPADRSPK